MTATDQPPTDNDRPMQLMQQPQQTNGKIRKTNKQFHEHQQNNTQTSNN